MISQRQLAKKYGISDGCLRSRLKKGWTLEEALTTPKYKGKRKPSSLKGNGKLKIYANDVEQLREKGLTTKQIAKQLNLNEQTIKRIVKTYNLPKQTINTHTHNELDKVISKLADCGYEYLGGYQGCESIIKVKCLKCGCVFERGYHNLTSHLTTRNGKPNCPNCRVLMEDHTQDIQDLLDKQRKRLGKQKDNQIKQLTNYLQVNQQHICKCANCGKEIVDSKEHKYCSIKCRDRYLHRRKDMLRDKRITSRPHQNITLDKLYKRDNGICYICGNKCNYQDHKKMYGNFYTGNSYPTIEHIKPIAKGGTNTWDNVKLACFRCNTLKGTKELNPLG